MHYIIMAQPNKISQVQIEGWTTVPSSLFSSLEKMLKPLRPLVEIRQKNQYDSDYLDAASEHCERTMCPYRRSQNNFLLNQL